MKTQDQHQENAERAALAPNKMRSGSRLASLGAVLVVLLLVGVSVLIFTELSLRHKNATTGSTGQWVQALKGYDLMSLVASQSNPSVLYACAVKNQANSKQQLVPPVYNGAPTIASGATLLRSSDGGAHWRDLGGTSSGGFGCQIAVNPTASNDIYAVVTRTVSPGGQVSSSLEHSQDGGLTWTSMQPVLKTPFAHAPVPLNLEQISMVGGHLFGLVALPNMGPGTGQTHVGVAQPALLPFTRLVTSVDGGHSWTVIDGQLSNAQREIWSFAVDPTNPDRLYALVSSPWPPIPVTTPQAVVGMNEALYASSNGGASWRVILNNLPFGSQVRLPSAQPGMIYVGGTILPMPVASGAPTGAPSLGNGVNPVQSYIQANGLAVAAFHLQVSRDGGASWRTIPEPSHVSYVQNWLVGANGAVYIDSAMSSGEVVPGMQATAMVVTAVAATPQIVPPSASQTGNAPGVVAPGIPQMGNASGVGSGAPSVAQSHMLSAGPQLTVQRYDPATNRWSALATSPVIGLLLSVTLSATNGGDVLWLLVVPSGQSEPVLYRYTV